MVGELEVVIAGAGVAGLEAALALRALAEERVNVTLLTPRPSFEYHPSVSDVLTKTIRVYPLPELLEPVGVQLVSDSFRWVDTTKRTVHTRGGETCGYDALLLAVGARRRAAFRYADTLDETLLGEHLEGLLGEVSAGSVRRVAALIPEPGGWPLPLYELVLLLARGAAERGAELELTVVTAEDAPLAVFGPEVSDAISGLLDDHGVRVAAGAACEVPAPGQVTIGAGLGALEADRILALPELAGPSTPGIPKRARRGFLSTDRFCRVTGVEGVFAAGDATDFPVRFGAVAAQQADTAAAAIARMAGAEVELEPFRPIVRGVLLGGAEPLYVSAHLTGARGWRSQLSPAPSWSPPTTLAATYLDPYLERFDPAPTPR